jgi:putative hydrolase of HD superfamily
MDETRLRSILDFLQDAEQLKNILRSGRTSSGRPESTAEHTWRLCLMVMLFEKELVGVDFPRLLKLCVVHDLGEAISGDVPAIDQSENDDRAARERADLARLCAPLPEDLQGEVIDFWEEYTAGLTPEAVLAKGFDKLETILQHVVGANPPDFDHAFNLTYGAERTATHPLLQDLRKLVDEATSAKIWEMDE